MTRLCIERERNAIRVARRYQPLATRAGLRYTWRVAGHARMQEATDATVESGSPYVRDARASYARSDKADARRIENAGSGRCLQRWSSGCWGPVAERARDA
jgi:hypothetical protein